MKLDIIDDSCCIIISDNLEQKLRFTILWRDDGEYVYKDLQIELWDHGWHEYQTHYKWGSGMGLSSDEKKSFKKASQKYADNIIKLLSIEITNT